MQRRDAVILAVGALLVAGATLYASAASGDEGTFRLRYTTVRENVASPLRGDQPTATTQVTANVTVPVNATLVRAQAWMNATAGPSGAVFLPGASIHATLRLPNGTTLEREATAAPGDASLQVSFDVPLAPLPTDADVSAASEADALRKGNASSLGAGEWLLTLQYAAPADVVGVSPAILFVHESWRAEALPATPDAK